MYVYLYACTNGMHVFTYVTTDLRTFPSSFDFRFTSYFKLDATDNANVNVLPVGTHMFAINDGSIIHEFDPETLSQMERVSINLNASHTRSTENGHGQSCSPDRWLSLSTFGLSMTD